MRLILARLRTTGGEPPSVHAWRTLNDAGSSECQSACGVSAVVDELEQVSQFTGAPCAACLVAAVHTAGPDAISPGDTTEPDPGPVNPVVVMVDGPEESSDGAWRYGIALRGEQVTHLVEPGSTRGFLDGRDVVQTVCRCLAWGPLATQPSEWPLCPDCVEVTASASIASA